MSSDERLKKATATDAGLDLVGRLDNRRTEDRSVTERRELSEDDRLRMFQQQLFNDALPDLPPIDGYHVCWLTTTNPRDPIHRRIALGYEPVKAEEVPGFEYASIKTGEYAGLIGVNEMVAFKLPMSLYHRFMQEAHHDAPRRDEERLAEVVDVIRQQAESSGAALIEGDGNEALREATPRYGKFEG